MDIRSSLGWIGLPVIALRSFWVQRPPIWIGHRDSKQPDAEKGLEPEEDELAGSDSNPSAGKYYFSQQLCSTCHFTVFRNVFIDMKFTRSQCIEKAHSYWCNKKITFCSKNSLKPVKNHRLHIFLAKCSFFGTLFIHQVYDHWTSGVAVLRVMRALNRLNYVNKLENNGLSF